MIQKIKTVVCDECKCAIDYYDGNIPNKRINEWVVKLGGIIAVKRRKHFCDIDCYVKWEKEKKNED